MCVYYRVILSCVPEDKLVCTVNKVKIHHNDTANHSWNIKAGVHLIFVDKMKNKNEKFKNEMLSCATLHPQNALCIIDPPTKVFPLTAHD